MPKFRVLYPEYKDMDNEELSTKMYERIGRPNQIHPVRPWMTVLQVAGIALGVPLGLFVVGSALFWAGAGFRGQA